MEKLALTFNVLDEAVSVESPHPPQQARLDQVLPFLKILDDKAIAIAVKKDGHAVSCAKGCATCCRIQPVPVTPAEAYALLLLVEELPEPERTAVLARFSDRVARLEAAGLADAYLSGPSDTRAFAEHYLSLNLACPFLEDDACSIYESRPFVCREYLVTTPKELCAQPLSGDVRTVPIILVPSSAIMAAATDLGGPPQRTIPLTLALTYAETNREALERTYPFANLLAQSLRHLFLAAHENGSLRPATMAS